MIICTGSSNLLLASQLKSLFNDASEILKINYYPNGEIFFDTPLRNLSAKTVCILQSLNHPVHNHLVELLFIVRALKQASVRKIIAIIPYFAYGRQDKQFSPFIPFYFVMEMLKQAGIDKVITIDFHNLQLIENYSETFQNLSAIDIFAKDIKKKSFLNNLIIISPDKGGAERAKKLALKLNLESIVMEKVRSTNNIIKITPLNDHVHNKNCILMDDIFDSGQTLYKASSILKKAGALSVQAYVTHGLFTNFQPLHLKDSYLDEISITNTISLLPFIENHPKIHILNIEDLLLNTLKNEENESY